MKRLSGVLLRFVALVVCVSPVFAETRTWTGGGDGRSWSDAGNWDTNGAPISGENDDVVIDFSAATEDLTMTTGDGPLSVGTIRIKPTTNAVLTITGGKITFTHQSADITVREDCALYVDRVGNGRGEDSGTVVRILNDIEIPEAGDYAFGRGGDYYGFNTVELGGVISGEGTLTLRDCSVDGRNRFALSGHNTYSGGTRLDRGRVTISTIDAFGTDTTSIIPAARRSQLTVDADGTFPYPFEVAMDDNVLNYIFELYLHGEIDYTGTLTGQIVDGEMDESADAYQIYIYTEKAGRNVTFSGDIDLPYGSILPWAGTSRTLTFTGNINCRTVKGHNLDNLHAGTKKYTVAGNSVDEIQIGIGTHLMEVENAFLGADLRFMGFHWWDDGCHLQLNGHSQIFGNLDSDINGDACKGHDIVSSTPVRVTVKPDRDCLATCLLKENITFAVDAVSADAVLTLSNRVHTMDGALIVSNGTLHVNGETTFRNVSTIEVAGGTLDLRSWTGAAFSGVTSITVGKNAILKVGETQPFATSGVTVNLADETARIEVDAGISLMIDAIYVGGVALDGGTYSGDPANGTVCEQITGAGTVILPELAVEAKPVSWTGNGASSEVTDLANWSEGTLASDFTSKGLYPTFAEKGFEAVFPAMTYLRGLVFDIPGGQATNVFSLTGTGPLSLYDLGITLADKPTGESYRYVIDVPLQLRKQQEWNLSTNPLASVEIRKPISGMFKLTKTGAGTLGFHAESPDFSGDVELSGGSGSEVGVYADNAFGLPTETSRLAVNTKLSLYGVDIERPVDVDSSKGGSIYARCGTNVITKQALQVYQGGQFYCNVAKDAVLRFDGGIKNGYANDNWYFNILKDGEGTLEITKRSYANVIQARYGLVRILVSGCGRGGSNPISASYQFPGAATVQFGGAFYLNGGWSDVTFNNSDVNNFLDLNGFNQRCGMLKTVAHWSRGCVYSKTPATLFSNVRDDNDMGKIDITGAASIVFSADKLRTNTIDRAISTTGTFSLSNKVTLVMTENASWLNPTNGTVTVADSSRLVLKRKNALSRRLDLSLSGDGVLEMAGGEKQRCADLYLDDSGTPAALGTYGATGSGAQYINDDHFAGTGVLVVYGAWTRGTMILVR